MTQHEVKIKNKLEIEFKQVFENIIENINSENVKCIVVCNKLFEFYCEKFNNDIKKITINIQDLNNSTSLHLYYKKLNSMFSFYIGYLVAKKIKDSEKTNYFLNQVIKNWEESLKIIELI